ncbi:MAG: hypothetical protein J6P16_05835, partial [Eubacterium sp.]|nr:hypothetical protein [Eubacterium sp.]
MRKINFRKKSVWMRAGAFFLAVSMMFWLMPFGVLTAHAEAGVYITSITLMQGSLSAESLDESGYNVIAQPLNPAGVENLYMGYQTGGESGAIRDIMVSSDGGDSIDVNGISYQKVSDVNMNDGTDGKEIYLYVSHDEQAGEPLRGLSFHVKKAQGSYSDDSYVLASDGSEIVTTDDGKLADFDEGIADSELYLRMYKGNLYRPYVDNVIVATAENEEAAVSELAAKRCTYYVNYDIGDEKSVLVGYTRTDDESEALRALVAVGGDPAELNDVQSDEDTADTSDDDAQADGSQPTDSDIVIKDIVYTMVEGGSVNSDKNYTFYMTKDENAGEP